MILLLVLSGCAAAESVPETERHAEGASDPFIVGVGTHFGQDKGLLPSNLRAIGQAGATSIRDEVYWSGVEEEKGELRMPLEWDRYVREAAGHGLRPTLILNYGNPYYDEGRKPRSEEALEGFVRYSKFVVNHFEGVVDLYEVWNEFDIGIGTPGDDGGAPAEYVELLRRTYSAVKAVDSTVTVLGGAPTPGGVGGGWLQGALQEGALDYADAISIHAYNYGEEGYDRTPEAWAEWMRDVQDMLRSYNGGEEVPLYVTEMGWPTHRGERGTPPEESAAFLARLYLLGRTMPFIKGIWWYDFQDDGWEAANNEHNFGLVRPDLTPKPAYHVLRDVAGLVSRSLYLGRLETGREDVLVLRFRRADGQHTWAVWSTDGERQIILQRPEDAPSGLLRLQQVGAEPVELPWGYRTWTTDVPEYHADRFAFVATGRPTLVTGSLNGARIEKVKTYD